MHQNLPEGAPDSKKRTFSRRRYYTIYALFWVAVMALVAVWWG